ncbi:hypothetical protein KNE206_74530 [Kitasatospora sp. NE20-6]|uniref:hypothetical protein n=1 Tax=Kitasatospora sp. NE20-6 TaxID=2859066 RepID=UPI0034DCB74A
MVPTDRGHLATVVEDLQALPGGTDPDRRRTLTRWVGIGLPALGGYRDARTFLQQALDLAEAALDLRAEVDGHTGWQGGRSPWSTSWSYASTGVRAARRCSSPPGSGADRRTVRKYPGPAEAAGITPGRPADE